MTTSPDLMDDGADEEFELIGTLNDYWTHTQVRDWVLLLPDMTRTALHLYMVLRSMIRENVRRKGGGLRRMSVDQLCFLLPGVNKKPCSPTMVKDALKLLDELNLVVNPEDGHLVKSTGKGGIQNSFRTYQVNELPPDAYVGWRNVWDKLDAYTPDWRENPPEPPLHTRRGDQVVQTSAGSPAPAAAQPEEPKPDAPAKQAPAAKKAPAKKTAPKKTAPKKAAPPKKDQEDGGDDVPADTSAAKPVVDAWAEGMKAAGHSFLPKRAKLIATEAAELLEAGADVDHLCRVAEWMGRMKPTWKVLEDAMTWPEAPQPSVPGQRSGRPAPEMCEHHPAFAAGDCPQCRLAERERRQRGASEPDSIDGAGLLARLRAGQPA
ncbi:hypothetical protein ACIQWZ_38175 [Streptomyces sp. NPDC098077]|uniref:hypothetical protein n=1 Tax=Streptomyces sp. NPDC098077 TaxID=3366093 RepID=UPI003829E057